MHRQRAQARRNEERIGLNAMGWLTAHGRAGLLRSFALLLPFMIPSASPASSLVVRELLCQSGREAVGLGTARPQLSWRYESSARDQRQSAYQIQVASSLGLLERGEPDLWDSGKVATAQSLQVAYAGRPLDSRARAFWRVRGWDADDQPCPYSAPSHWEVGLLASADWRAEWIGFTAGWSGRALYFRRAFTLAKTVTRARVYVSGVGYCELRLDGRKVGDRVLEPGWTDYTQRVLYSTYDVTSSLTVGDHVIGAIVGHGWHGTPKLLLQLEVEFTDGTHVTIATEGGHSHAPEVWYVTSGPILRDSVYDGETYDARLEKPCWDVPSARLPTLAGQRSEGWETAVAVGAPGGVLVAQEVEPIRVVETRSPVAVTEPKPGVYVFDGGQNAAGWAALQVQGPAGARIALRFAETLGPDGQVNQANLRNAAATDVYVLKGGAVEKWEPRFTYHGFRYVQIEGWPGVPTLDAVRIRVVRSDVEAVGAFQCSNELLNRIHRMVAATEASNLHSVPTDCPQRDERMGWLNDMTVRAESAVYDFRLARLYAKWVVDISDTQSADGAITDTAPFKWGKRPADPVSISYLLTTWHVYQHYGDAGPLRREFPRFRAWVDYLLGRSAHGLLAYSSWGDWAPPESEAIAGSAGAGAVSATTPGGFISTGYLWYHLRLLAEMARVLGDESEADRRVGQAADVQQAFRRQYWDPAIGGYGSNNQACNAFVLALGLADAADIPRVVANLVRAVEARSGHLSTGNLCTKYLLEALSDHGHADLALRIATQRTYPSWGFMLEQGATTLWERWEHLTGGAMNSHNHPMLGSVESWLYRDVAGVRADPTGPGFSRFTVQPCVVDGLAWAEASYRTLHGLVRSRWNKEAGALRMAVSVPVNTTARVRLPAPYVHQVTESGVPLASAGGVRAISKTDAAITFELGSGDYEIVGDSLPK